MKGFVALEILVYDLMERLYLSTETLLMMVKCR